MSSRRVTERRAQRLAALLQGALNDLKRDRDTAARELDVTPAMLDFALTGSWVAAATVRERMVERWPISERDLAPLVDDTDRGVIVRSVAEAQQSSRVLNRGGAPYYEYRDVAMSQLSPIRPEWIRMLACTEVLDPDDPDIRWNEGHALHQLTYFRGPVDFYVEVSGRRAGYAMQEGDSAFIPSFLPHTFATREPEAEPHILAVTFHGRIHGDVRQELALADLETLQHALRSRGGFGARLQVMLDEACLCVEELARRTSLPNERVSELLHSGSVGEGGEVERIAQALGVSPMDLLGDRPTAATPVITRRAELATWPFPSASSPSYIVRTLAHSEIAPRARGIVLTAPKVAGPYLEVGLHQFAYVLGPGAVRLNWSFEGRDHEQVLDAGDSYYLPPWRKHSLQGLENAAEVLVFRAPNALHTEALDELNRCELRAQERFVAPEHSWYRP